jgi:hypothetical protein
MTSKPSWKDGYGRTSTNHLTIIKIDKETFIDLYLFILLLFESFI